MNENNKSSVAGNFEFINIEDIKQEPELEIIDVIIYEDQPTIQSNNIDLNQNVEIIVSDEKKPDLKELERKTGKGRFSTRYVKKEDGLLHCNFCSHKGRNKPGMSVHFKVKHVGIPFLCRHCKSVFQDPSTRNRHEQVVHEKAGRYNKRKNHPLTCPICTKTFLRLCRFRDHLRQAHKYDPKSEDLATREMRFFQCYHCDMKFAYGDKEEMEKHLIDQHFKCLKPKPKAQKIQLCTTLVDGKYRCRVCGYCSGPDKEKAYFHIANCYNKRVITGKRNSCKNSSFLECFHCGLKLTTDSKTTLRKHLISQHFPKALSHQSKSKYRTRSSVQNKNT